MHSYTVTTFDPNKLASTSSIDVRRRLDFVHNTNLLYNERERALNLAKLLSSRIGEI